MAQAKIKIADIAATGTPSSSTYYRGDNTWATAPLPAGYNNTNWDTAYSERNRWDGSVVGLTATTGRVSLGIDKITNLLNANYTALVTDKVIATSIAFTAARTVTIPAANTVNAGYELIIADLFGTITSTNTLIIARAGTDTINGATSIVIGAAYGMRRLFSDGISKWTLDAGVMRISDYIGTTLTPSVLIATDSNSKLQPLSTAIYPSLTELSYLKGVTGSIISGSLTSNYIPKASGVSTLSNSSIQDNGTTVTITNSLSIIGLQSLQGTTASDTAPLGSELTTTGTSDGSWTGTSFATGYTHTSGTATALTSTLAAVIGNLYRINTTITGRTAGSITLTFGGVTFYTGQSTTRAFAQKATATTSLNITPTSDFDGTIVLNIQVVGVSSSITTWKNTSGNAAEIRGTTSNLFIGINAGAHSTVLESNSYLNTHIGHQSGYWDVGRSNTSLGYQSQYLNTSGVSNVAIGYNAGYTNSTSGTSTAIGALSLFSNTSSANTAIGSESLTNLSVGISNTAIGTQAGKFIVDGVTALTLATNSIFLGYNTKALADNQANQIVIGYNSTGLGPNTTILGNSSIIGNLVYGNKFFTQNNPTAITATSTLTIAQLLTNIITVTSAIAVSLTLPTGTLTDAGILAGALPINTAFDFTIINLGSSVGIVTLVAGTDHTIIGLATIPIVSQATFRTRKTAANTYVTYRIF